MSLILRYFRARRCLLAALFGFFLVPGVVQACWIGFRNDTDFPVVVQGAAVVKGRLRWGTPHVLYPGEVCWNCVVQAGKKQMVVFNAKKRVLSKQFITCGADDQFFAITPAGPGEAELTPAKPPASSGKIARR
jgi:hypothetical protein